VLGRNLGGRSGELDLVVEDRRDGCIVVVEVKAGTRENPPPEVHVDPRKRRRLSALAAELVRRHRLEDRAVRFDVVAVVWPEGARRPSRVTHHAHAFESSL
jgi:Holliday junction resolvase-like predicted endonuclease